jgi:hypothetical protein
MQLNSQRIPINLFLLCLGIEILLVFLDVSINFYRYSDTGAIRRLFNMTREDGLGSWFMVLQTTVAAMTLLLISLLERERNRPSKKHWYWAILAVFFLYLSADDAAKIHERLGTLFDSYRSEDGIGSLFPSYGWQLAVLPFFSIAGLAMVWFLWAELKAPKARALLILAPAIMALAVTLDFFEGLEHEHPWNLYTWLSEYFQISPKTIRHFGKTTEEFLEMLSISLLLMLFVQRLLQSISPQWTIYSNSSHE